MSILSPLPDGFGYHYGFAGGDHRQVNVRREGDEWVAYVGEKIGAFATFAEAEAAAVKFVKDHPA